MTGAVELCARTACKQCPWRTANQGRRNPGSFYTKANLRRLWAGMRRGERMTCHPTDTRMNDYDHMNVPVGVTARECTGAVVLVARELLLLEQSVLPAALRDGLEPLREYRRLRPLGLTTRGLARIYERALFDRRNSLRDAGVDPLDDDVQHPGFTNPVTAAMLAASNKRGAQ